MSHDSHATTQDLKLSRWGHDKALTEHARTIERNPRATIVPSGRTPDTAGRAAIRDLEALGHEQAPAHGLRLGKTLGSGGMGLVRLATQASLDRQVAVKTVRPEHRNDRALMKLLREAWLTGSLEHPNVAPVYELYLDAEGQPMVVLKRIEGVAWDELMHDRERAGLDSDEALFDTNLDTLMQVCRAVSFAHSRGVLHRDIKPENVMVGAFGEVYLLDWGIAVGLEHDPSGRLPTIHNSPELAGTPCYMAPEMFGADLGSLSTRTDVYLLGAVLYEIVTGLPPHRGETAAELMHSAMRSPPPLPPAVPAELASIIRTALAADPGERHASAEAFRLALAGFRQHRGSALLAREAEAKRALLPGLVEAAREDPGRRAELYNTFGACRFGFRQALHGWADNEAARDGLRQATLAMVSYELSHDDDRAAASLLAELDAAPPGELAMAVEEARARREREKERVAALETMGQQLDRNVGTRTRMFVGGLLGLMWTVTPLLSPLVHETTHFGFIGVSVGQLAIAAALAFWGRESLTKTAINRRIVRVAGILFLTQVALGWACHVLEIPAQKMLALVFLLWSMLSATVAVTVDRRLWPTAVVMPLALVAATWRPGAALYIASLACLAFTVNVVLVWRPDQLFAPRPSRALKPR